MKKLVRQALALRRQGAALPVVAELVRSLGSIAELVELIESLQTQSYNEGYADGIAHAKTVGFEASAEGLDLITK